MSANDQPSVGDRNTERLLGHAYQPEVPDPAFVRRVEERLCAEARDLAQLRPPVSRPTFGRLALVMQTATALAILALSFQFFPRGSHAPENTPQAKDGAVSDPVGLVPRPRLAAPPAASLAVGEEVKTTAGQRRRVTLPDGSVAYLNQNTAVKLDAERRLKLSAGEVYLEVAPRAPGGEGATYTVQTPDRQVAALGTRFAVTAGTTGTGVVVAQGKVRVAGFDGLVRAGQQLAPDGAAVRAAPRLSHVLDWTRDLMTAAESPLVPASQYASGALVAVDPNGQEARLSLRKYHIDVHIEDGFARTTIDQTYFNHESWRLEGTFYFPLPPDASLSRLAMYVDGKLMEGGMAERDYARQVFETIVTRQKDPALLEWVDGSTFKMRVFPLEARQEKRIILSYAQRLEPLYGRTRYRFPAGHNLDQVRDWSFHGRVKGGAGLEWSSPSHPNLKAVNEGGDLVLDAAARNIKLDRDLALELQDARRAAGQEDLAHFSSAVHEGSRYLMLRYRPQLPGRPVRQRRDWVFLFESSGDRDPLLARVQVDILRTLLDNAEHDDTFAILTAGTRVHTFAPTALPATPDNVRAAVAFLDRTHLVGALDLEGALKAAELLIQAAQNPYLVHVGSGIAALGERRDDVLVKRLPAGVRYVGVGVGKRWGRAWMKTAAEATSGYFTQINPDEPVGWRAFELLATLNTPRLLNVNVVDDAEQVKLLRYAGALAQGEEICAITRLPADQPLPESVTVSGTLDGKPFQRRVRVADVAGDADYQPRTWAKLEIDRLLAEDADKNRADIVALSKAMYVMTPFTSLLVLENEQMYEQYQVDRGRKDHWAMYPCPERIPVIYEPLPGQVVDNPNAPTGVEPGGKLTVAQILKTILVRQPPRFLDLPNLPSDPERLLDYFLQQLIYDVDGVDRTGPRSSLRSRFEDVDVVRGAVQSYRLSVVGRDGKISVGVLADKAAQAANSQERLKAMEELQKKFAEQKKRRVPVAEKDGLLAEKTKDEAYQRYLTLKRLEGSSVQRCISLEDILAAERVWRAKSYEYERRKNMVHPIPAGKRAVAVQTAQESVAGGFVLPGSHVDVIHTSPSGKSRVVLQDVLVLAVDRLDRRPEDRAAGLPGSVTPTDPGGLFPRIGTVDRAGVIPHVVTLEVTPEEARHLVQFKSEGSITLSLRPLGDTAMIPHTLADLAEDLRRWPREPRGDFETDWGSAVPLRGRLERWVLEAKARRSAGADPGQQTPVTAELREQLGGLEEGQRTVRVISVKGVDPALVQQAIDAILNRRAPPSADPSTHERPTFSGDDRVFYELTAYAPGMHTTAADIRAVVDAEATGSRTPLGLIDPAARQLIERARNTAWQSFPVEGSSEQPGFQVILNGADQYAYERTLSTGLRERVVCDGQRLLHLYPEIGLATRRSVSRFHRAELAELVPWYLPPVEDLARGADLKCSGDRTVVIVPRPTDPAQPDGKPRPYVAVHLLFAPDGRLAERRLVEMPANQVVYRETYAADGQVKVLDADGQVVAEWKLSLRAATAPDLAPDLSRLVVLPIPCRTTDYLRKSLTTLQEKGQTAYKDLDEPDAVALLVAELVSPEPWKAFEIFRQRFDARGDRRPGFYTLLVKLARSGFAPFTFHAAFSGVGKDSQAELTRYFKELATRHPQEPLAQYLGFFADPQRARTQAELGDLGGPRHAFLQNLATFRDLYWRWTSGRAIQGDAAQGRAQLQGALAFIRECPCRPMAWALLNVVRLSRFQSPDAEAALAEAYRLFERLPGMAYTARYEQARCLLNQGKWPQALARFRELHAQTLEAGLLPPIDDSFRQAFQSDSQKPKAWSRFMHTTAASLVAQKRRPVVLDLAWQCWWLGDPTLANELFHQAVTGLTLEERPATTLAALEYLRLTSQLERAEPLLPPLLATEPYSQLASLWRLAARLAEQRENGLQALPYLETALEIQYQNLPDVINLATVRKDYADLLAAYQKLAEAVAAGRVTPPRDFRSRVVRAADRWRALDTDPTAACQAAAKVLKALGETELAWDYLTTPVGQNPNQAAAWLDLAQALRTEGSRLLADRAYGQAFAAEPTNAQILWDRAQNLERAGKKREARALWEQIAEGQWQPRFQGLQTQARQQLGTP